MSVIARREEIGMLRALGVARRTVLALFLGEALTLGVAGCAVGIAAGWALRTRGRWLHGVHRDDTLRG